MTTHEFALSDLAARLTGTDASLSTSLRDILTVALQELIEAELTATIGAGPGERTIDRVTQRNGHRPKLVSTPGDQQLQGTHDLLHHAPGRNPTPRRCTLCPSTRPTQPKGPPRTNCRLAPSVSH